MRFIPIYFEEVFGQLPTVLTMVVLMGQVVSVASPLVCMCLAERFGRAPVMVIVRVVEVCQHPCDEGASPPTSRSFKLK